MTGSLHTLLQLTDSQFPAGAFAHSLGLEALLEVAEGIASERLRALLEGIWRQQLLPTDGWLGLQAHRAMRHGDLDEVCRLDRELFARKLPRELREASIATGRSFLDEAAAALGDARVEALRDRVARREAPGNQAIAFSAAMAAAGVPEDDCLLAWGYQASAQLAAALLRLGLIGHRQAQRLLADVREAIETGIGEILSQPRGTAWSFAPRLEIASMRHERQYTRLFRS